MSDGTRPTAALDHAANNRQFLHCPNYDPSDFALRRDSAYG